MNKIQRTNDESLANEAVRAQRGVVLVTRAMEYLVASGVCLAVRERATGEFLDDHCALHERVHCEAGPAGLRLCVDAPSMTIRSGHVEHLRRASTAERRVVRRDGWLCGTPEAAAVA